MAVHVEQLQEWYPEWGRRHTRGTFEWTSGGTSWWLSRPAAEMFAAALPTFLARVKPFDICYCPDVITGLLLSLLGLRIIDFPPPYYGWARMNGYAVDSQMADFADVSDVVLYHYVTPRRMLAADQRVHRQKLDQMANAGDAAAVLAYARRFAAVHRAVCRRREAQLQMLARRAAAPPPRLRPLDAWVERVERAAAAGDADAMVAALRRLIDAHFGRLRTWQTRTVQLALAAQDPPTDTKPGDIPLIMAEDCEQGECGS